MLFVSPLKTEMRSTNPPNAQWQEQHKSAIEGFGDPLFAKVVPWHNQLATSLGHVALRLTVFLETRCTWLLLILLASWTSVFGSRYRERVQKIVVFGTADLMSTSMRVVPLFIAVWAASTVVQYV